MLVHTPGSKVVGTDDEGNKYYEDMSKQIGKRAACFDQCMLSSRALLCSLSWPVLDILPSVFHC